MTTKKVLEIEKKFICNNIQWLTSQAQKDGFVLHESNLIENDLYFTDAQNEFIEKRICLRIRETNESCELTYKWASLKHETYYSKVENNIPLERKYKSSLREMLQNLWYLEYVEVNKTRSIYTLTKVDLQYNIVIDEIQGVGIFVEFEILAHYQVIEDLRGILDDFIANYSEFGLTEVNLPYRDLVKKHMYS